MRILALDVGAKKIGVAISDVDQTIITPLETIVLKKFSGRDLFDQLQINLRQKWNEIEAIVIGIPYNVSGDTLSFSYKYVAQCLKIFKAWTTWQVIEQSETYSSQWAEQFLKIYAFSSKQVKARSDSYAALKILFDYFLTQNKTVLISFLH